MLESGKSSAVRAGLVPTLRANAVPGSEHWLVETLKPGRTPLDDLALAAARLARNPAARQDLTTRGLSDPTLLDQWLELAMERDAEARVVLVIDQFEEIFTQLPAERESERAAFLSQLTAAATAPGGRVIVLFTLRSDFVINCATYPDLNALLNQNFMQVGAMSRDELVSAIARPALQAGLRMDPALVAHIVNDVRGEPGALPLMQFALQDLFQAEQGNGELTLDGYLERGGLRQALERHADAEFEKLDDTGKHLARTVLSGLVEIGQGRQDTKRTALFGELVPAGADAAQVRALIGELADARLITTDVRDGKETITLAHEHLIEGWTWLRRLVDENREAIAFQNEIAQDAQEWETHGRDESYLYRGARLATAQEKLQQDKLVLNALSHEFVDQALAARERERAEREAARERDEAHQRALREERVRAELEQARQRTEAAQQRARILRVAAAGLGVLLLLALTAAGFALRATVEAQAQQQISRSRELAALAVHQLESDPERALIVAIRANEVAHTVEAENALRQALLLAPLVLREPTGTIRSAAFAPDSTRILTSSKNGSDVWDANTGKQLAHLAGNLAVYAPDGTKILNFGCAGDAGALCPGVPQMLDAASFKPLTALAADAALERAVFSPDGTRLATINARGEAQIWDAQTARQIATLGQPGQPRAGNILFSPDGTRVITAHDNGMVKLWDAGRGTLLVSWQAHTYQVTSASFSPDGTKIVSTSTGYSTRLWNVSDLLAGSTRELASFQRRTSSESTASFSPDNRRVVTTGWGDNAKVWDAATGKELVTLEGHSEAVTSARFSPDGARIVTGSLDGTVIIWDAATGNLLLRWRGQGGVRDVSLSPDGKRIVAVDGETALVWDANESRELATLPGGAPAFSADGSKLVTVQCVDVENDDCTQSRGWVWNAKTGERLVALQDGRGYVDRAEFSPDGSKILFSGCDDVLGDLCLAGSAQLWDAQSGVPLARLPAHRASFSPDGSKILTVGCERVENSTCVLATARIRDTATGAVLVTLPGKPDYMTNASYSSDGKRIVTAECDDLEYLRCALSAARVWDAASGTLVTTLSGHNGLIASAAFSNDGTRIVTAGLDATARLWDARTGANLAILRDTNYLFGALLSPDASQVLVAAPSAPEIWDAATSQKLYSWRGYLYFMSRANFSPDGSQLIAPGDAGTATVWDTHTGKQVFRLAGHTTYADTAAFSPDGTRIATATADTTRLYLVHIQDLLALAHSRTPNPPPCREIAQITGDVCPNP